MAWTRSGWSKSWSGVVAMAIVAWAVVYFPAGQVTYAINRGNNVTEIIDAYSEGGDVRAGEGYADHGFAYNAGLPDEGYGNAFDSVGGKHDPNLCPSLPCIYLHYPPGPELITGAMTKMCGKMNIPCLRGAPIFFGFLALLVFAWGAVMSIGVERTAFVLGSFYFAPMVTNGMHNLHYHSYVVSLLLVLSGLLLLRFLRPMSAKQERWVDAGIFLTGFFYGWMSFDYAFHVAFVSVAFWLMAPDWRKATRTMIRATLLVGTGYFVACVLHFIQVRMFLGSWAAVMADMGARASMRLNGHLESSVTVQPLVRLLWTYWTQLLLQPHFLGFSFLGACSATLTLLLVPSEVIASKRWSLAWAPRPTFKWAFVVAFIIPNLWLMLMRQHGSVHGHFLPRNFTVTYVVGAILIALSFRRTAAMAASTSTENASGGPSEAPSSGDSAPEPAATTV